MPRPFPGFVPIGARCHPGAFPQAWQEPKCLSSMEKKRLCTFWTAFYYLPPKRNKSYMGMQGPLVQTEEGRPFRPFASGPVPRKKRKGPRRSSHRDRKRQRNEGSKKSVEKSMNKFEISTDQGVFQNLFPEGCRLSKGQAHSRLALQVIALQSLFNLSTGWKGALLTLSIEIEKFEEDGRQPMRNGSDA